MLGYFARELPSKMTYPLVLDLADDGVPVAVTCRVLGFSKQAFYTWRATPVTCRDVADAYVIHAALRAMTMIRSSGTGSSPSNPTLLV